MPDSSDIMSTQHDPPCRQSIHPLAAVLWLVVAVVFASGVVGGIARGVADRPNWYSLRTEAAFVWEHHESRPGTAMFGYLPTATFALWPFMVWLRPPVGLTAYVCSNLLAAVGSVWIVRRWWMTARDPIAPLIVPVLLISANVQHVIQANQLTLWTLFLCVAGLALLENRRRFVGGAVLGLAGLIKVLPFLLVGYLLLRRQWRALFGVAVAVVVFDIVPSVGFFGWRGAITEHREWLRRAGWYSNTAQINDPLVIGVTKHGSNFSYATVLTHWLRAMPDADQLVVLFGDPPAEVVREISESLKPGEVLAISAIPPRDESWRVQRFPLTDVPRFCLADLSARTVWWIWAVTSALAAGALAYATWRAGRRSGGADWSHAGAMWMLAMLWFSPLTRHYYLALAFPAVAVVWQAMVTEFHRNGQRPNRDTTLGLVALLAWGVGLACLGWNAGRWYGLHLGVLLVLAIATARAWHRTISAATNQASAAERVGAKIVSSLC